MNDMVPKVRAQLRKYTGQREPGPIDPEGQDMPGQEPRNEPDIEPRRDHHHEPKSYFHAFLHEHYYVVVGFMMRDEGAPKETLRRVMQIDGLFKQIRNAQRHLRNPFRRALSLMEVCGFGIYECHPAKGYHKEVKLDAETEGTLAELWRAYAGHTLDYEGRWLLWIHEHFNNGSRNPEKGRLTLEFKLRWSVYKVVIWGLIPILLSLAIGFWYMYKDHGDIDEVAVAEAAWVIATYIITTSARTVPRHFIIC